MQAAAGGPRVPASWNPVIPASGQADRALAMPRGATLTPAEPTGERVQMSRTTLAEQLVDVLGQAGVGRAYGVVADSLKPWSTRFAGWT